ncbi:MAG: hypothetical protein WAN51_08055 [Alphaproteobacteria bacterium]
MTKFLTGVISAAALMAAVSVVGVTAGSGSAHADTLPPCSKTLNDHCIQMGGETMKPSPEVKAKQQENVKAVEKKAGEVGDATMKAAKKVGAAGKKKWHELTGEKKASSSVIPHGCSPATTPCE